MTRTFGFALAVLGSVLVAGCGGSSGLGLKAYTVRGNEEPGYKALGATRYATISALEQSGSNFSSNDVAQLKRNGFRGAAIETTGVHTAGLSFVWELGSVAGAEREFQTTAGEDLGSKGEVRFAVPAIPGAIGFAYPSTSGGGGANVLFREGNCVLLVGDVGTEAPALAGATAIWKRTHGVGGACSA